VATDIASVILDLEKIVLDQLAVFCFCNGIISHGQRRFDTFMRIAFMMFGENPIHKDDQANAWDNYSQTKLLQCDKHTCSQNTLTLSVLSRMGKSKWGQSV
jgi:hypothetical protein